MRILLDVTCLRCGAAMSHEGLSEELVREISRTHVCADGVVAMCSAPVERRVPGPGERTKLPEEREHGYGWGV